MTVRTYCDGCGGEIPWGASVSPFTSAVDLHDTPICVALCALGALTPDRVPAFADGEPGAEHLTALRTVLQALIPAPSEPEPSQP